MLPIMLFFDCKKYSGNITCTLHLTYMHNGLELTTGNYLLLPLGVFTP